MILYNSKYTVLFKINHLMLYTWFPMSPYLTSRDVFFCGCIKDTLYVKQLSLTIDREDKN